MSRRLTFLVLPLIVGCAGPAVHVTQAAPPSLPSGWNTATDAADGVSIGVAPGWHEGADQVLDAAGMNNPMGNLSSLNSNDPASALGSLQGQLQQMSQQAAQQALDDLKKKGIVLHVIDSSRPTVGEERTRYYVKLIKHDGNCSLDQVGAEESDYLRGLGADPVQTVSLPIGKALKFTADSKTRGGDETTHVCFVVVDGKNSYHLRFASTNSPDAIRSIADPVAQTWRIQPSRP